MAVSERSHAASHAVDGLYRRHGAEVYRYAFAVLGNHADAEDVTQTTFLNAYRAIEGGVKPRKPGNWLLTIASNGIKQRFRQESARPRQVVLDGDFAGASAADDEGPSVAELLSALSRIPPQQRQAIVLREFEGRSYTEIADILGVTTSALETLLFRARRSLAEELEQQLTCTDAQLAVSRAADGRLGRKERRRLRDHVGECADCARFARVQQRHRTAFRGLVLMPVPVSLTLLKGFEGTATAAVLPAVAVGAAGTGAVPVAAVGAGAAGGAVAGGAAAGGGVFAAGVAVKAAAVVTAAGVAGGVGVVGASEIPSGPPDRPAAKTAQTKRAAPTAPRGVLVPGSGTARGKAGAPGQPKATAARPAHATRNATTGNPDARRGQQRAEQRGQQRAASAQATPKARATSARGGENRATPDRPRGTPARPAPANPHVDGRGRGGQVVPAARERAGSRKPPGAPNN